MKTQEKAPKAPEKSVGGTASQGKNSKVDYRTAKTKFKMKHNI